jgi:hypothetical protein
VREKKIDNIHIYIVENIKFIYTSFDEFFLPVSQRVEMNYIFSDNVRLFYSSSHIALSRYFFAIHLYLVSDQDIFFWYLIHVERR